MKIDSAPADKRQCLQTIIDQLEPAIALAREQGLGVVAGVLITALEQARRELKSE